MPKISNNKVYCFDPKKQKFILIGMQSDDVLIKNVESNHFMRIVNGYGMQYDAFSRFKKIGIKKIKIHEGHTGNNWVSKPDDWIKNGRVADYGNGKQVFLSLKYMHFEKGKRQFIEELQKIMPEQSSLF